MVEASPAHVRSEGTINPSLKMFKVSPTDISINEYRSTHHLRNQPHGICDSCFDQLCGFGAQLLYHGTAIKKKGDHNNFDAADKLSVVNNLAHTPIKQIDLRLNGMLISPQSDTYHYKLFFETFLNYNREDGETVLRPQGLYNHLENSDAQ